MGSLFWPAAAREVGLVADREASPGQDDLGGALDQLLRPCHGESRVAGGRALDVIGVL
jgi:hypothetical protein